MSVGTLRVVPEKVIINKVILKPVSWLAKSELIKHLVLNNNVLISLLGEKNSGKTTFANLLKTDLSPQIKSRVIAANAVFNQEDFLQQLGVLLNIGGEPSLSNIVAQMNEQQSHQLLIIDDAHYLSEAFIEDILNALQQQGDSGYFHVCLVSGFSLVPTLNKLAETQYTDMIHSIELGTLSEGETKAYVVQNVLPQLNAMITDDRIKQFYQLTEGRMAGINRQMADFFSSEVVRPSRHGILFRQVSIAAGVFIAATGLSYLVLSQGFQSPPAQLVSLESPLQDKPEVSLDPVLSSDIPAYHASATRQEVQPTPLRRIELAALDDEDSRLNESLVVVDKVVVAPKVLSPQSEQKPAPTKKSTAAAARGATKQTIKKAFLKPVVEQSHYTIQLLASQNWTKLKSFAQAHHFDGKARVRRMIRQGSVWYVLTLGEYPQRQLAVQAIHHLPKDVIQFKPWVRTLADLKASG